jgi:hypothetical protein
MSEVEPWTLAATLAALPRPGHAIYAVAAWLDTECAL